MENEIKERLYDALVRKEEYRHHINNYAYALFCLLALIASAAMIGQGVADYPKFGASFGIGVGIFMFGFSIFYALFAFNEQKVNEKCIEKLNKLYEDAVK